MCMTSETPVAAAAVTLAIISTGVAARRVKNWQSTIGPVALLAAAAAGTAADGGPTRLGDGGAAVGAAVMAGTEWLLRCGAVRTPSATRSQCLRGFSVALLLVGGAAAAGSPRLAAAAVLLLLYWPAATHAHLASSTAGYTLFAPFLGRRSFVLTQALAWACYAAAAIGAATVAVAANVLWELAAWVGLCAAAGEALLLLSAALCRADSRSAGTNSGGVFLGSALALAGLGVFAIVDFVPAATLPCSQQLLLTAAALSILAAPVAARLQGGASLTRGGAELSTLQALAVAFQTVAALLYALLIPNFAAVRIVTRGAFVTACGAVGLVPWGLVSLARRYPAPPPPAAADVAVSILLRRRPDPGFADELPRLARLSGDDTLRALLHSLHDACTRAADGRADTHALSSERTAALWTAAVCIVSLFCFMATDLLAATLPSGAAEQPAGVLPGCFATAFTAMAAAPVLAHQAIGTAVHGARWRLWRPFGGGPKFVAAQAVAWLAYGGAVLCATTLCLNGLQTGGVVGAFTVCGVLGAAAHVGVVLSIRLFDAAAKAEALPRQAEAIIASALRTFGALALAAAAADSEGPHTAVLLGVAALTLLAASTVAFVGSSQSPCGVTALPHVAGAVATACTCSLVAVQPAPTVLAAVACAAVLLTAVSAATAAAGTVAAEWRAVVATLRQLSDAAAVRVCCFAPALAALTWTLGCCQLPPSSAVFLLAFFVASVALPLGVTRAATATVAVGAAATDDAGLAVAAVVALAYSTAAVPGLGVQLRRVAVRAADAVLLAVKAPADLASPAVFALHGCPAMMHVWMPLSSEWRRVVPASVPAVGCKLFRVPLLCDWLLGCGAVAVSTVPEQLARGRSVVMESGRDAISVAVASGVPLIPVTASPSSPRWLARMPAVLHVGPATSAPLAGNDTAARAPPTV
eukprot:TRINITY_DN17467_c0_g1_i5.p1 TRINITY_DN17467_c0_g1~~TRINITY_DN17467_c0_g1_i5.p1  ORF type:complete len:925 (+),score=197.37 TRINITY_DN17467_c0_g1_i5:591-3365(+)